MMMAAVACCFYGCKDPDDPTSSTNPDPILGDHTGRTPHAGFQYTVDASFTVEFENTSSDATTYKWDFGDGTTSTAVSPTHTYTSRGTKHVVLYAYNGITNVNSATANINMTSYIKMNNTSNNTYKIYIDGIEQVNLAGGNNYEFEVNPGSHTVKVVQQNGYALWPTEETYTHDCIAGYMWTRDFPDSPLGAPVE